MSDDKNTDMIMALVSAKQRLEEVVVKDLPDEYNTTQYNDIIKQISIFIENNCRHNKIRDEIDILPEKTIVIEYCTKCMKTFS